MAKGIYSAFEFKNGEFKSLGLISSETNGDWWLKRADEEVLSNDSNFLNIQNGIAVTYMLRKGQDYIFYRLEK